ncbi:MAG TPA: hypothetical protein PKA12_14925 [Saprospiraceae bacterium]|nr:hypothetical protein [Saprospiraceae bacterium]
MAKIISPQQPLPHDLYPDSHPNAGLQGINRCLDNAGGMKQC